MQTTAAPLSSAFPSPAPARGKPTGATASQADTTDARLPGTAFNARLEQARTQRDAGQADVADVAGKDPSKAGTNTTGPLPDGIADGAGAEEAVDTDVSASSHTQTVIVDPALAAYPLVAPVTVPDNLAVAGDAPVGTDTLGNATALAVGDISNLQGAAVVKDSSAWLDTLEQSRRMAAGLPASASEPGSGAETAGPAVPASTMSASVLAAQGAIAGRAVQDASVGKARNALLPETADATAVPADEAASSLPPLTGTLSQPAAAARSGGRHVQLATAGSQDRPAIVRPASTLQGNARPVPGETPHGAIVPAGDAAGSAIAPVTQGVNTVTGSTAMTPADAPDSLQHPGTVQIFDDAALPYQLHHHLRWMQTRGQGTAELQLNPAELGPVHVTVKMEERRVEASFLCAQPMTRDLIEAAMPRLREAMESAGMELAGGFVGTGDFGTAADTQHSSHTGGESRMSSGMTADTRTDEPSAVIPRVVRHEGMVDTFA